MEDYRKHTSMLQNVDWNQTSHKQSGTTNVLNVVSQAMMALNQNISIRLLGIVSLTYLA